MDNFEKGIMKELGADKPPVTDPGAEPVDLKVDYDLPEVEGAKRDQFEESLMQHLTPMMEIDSRLMDTDATQVVERAPTGRPANLLGGVPLVRFKRCLPAGDSDSAINIVTRKSGAKVRVLDSDHGRFYQFESNEEASDAVERLESYGLEVELIEAMGDDKGKLRGYKREFKDAMAKLEAQRRELASAMKAVTGEFKTYAEQVKDYDPDLYAIDDHMRFILDDIEGIGSELETAAGKMADVKKTIRMILKDYDAGAGY